MTTERPQCLLICYYFPPWGMGGVQRPLKFAKYLGEFGWDLTVLTAAGAAYYKTDDTLLTDLPQTVRVIRIPVPQPPAALKGGATARPPRWARTVKEWLRWPDDKIIFARRAVREARRLAPAAGWDIVCTSSPPPSIHRAGLALSAHSGWIADFRDPWYPASDDWGPTPLHAAYGRWLRRGIVQRADRLVAVNDGIAAILDRDRPSYPTTVIHNGYDDDDFTDLTEIDAGGECDIVCPGTFSASTDPRPLYDLLRRWKGGRTDHRFRLTHVGASVGIDEPALVSAFGLQENYRTTGYLPHREAVAAACSADVIVIPVNDTPGYEANVPGRLFEALRTLRPLLLLASKHNAAARLVAHIPGCWVIAPGDHEAGCRALSEIAALPRRSEVRNIADISQFDRRDQTRRLARLMDDVRSARRSRA